jgi:hypothetical protein
MLASKAAGAKVPVTLRSLISRINRKLAHQGRRLHVAKGQHARGAVGDYFIADASTGVIANSFARDRLEDMARELGCLSQWEELTEGETK